MAAAKPVWRKSSASGSEENCVECATTAHEVLVRDSKAAHGGVMRVTGAAWAAFIGSLTERAV
ncbi:DUF397 domain-containing protein [Streptomyces sp. NPDC048187]|uniref:DUF397 domain-containing protein n=1 Tax=Streptomyces sp. NPDC048187 TaxID=3365509 RepID=UPI0037178381